MRIFHFKFMIDINFIKYNVRYLINNLSKKGYNFDFYLMLNLDKKIKFLKFFIQELRCERNFKTKLIKIYKYNNKYFSSIKKLKYNIRYLRHNILNKELYLSSFLKKINSKLSCVPNVLHSTVPLGKNFLDNIIVRKIDFLEYRTNIICNGIYNKKYIDFDISAKISGTGFVILKNKIAILYRALGNYMLDFHIDRGFNEINSPLMVNKKSMFNSGHFPKFLCEQFRVSDFDLWLIPTSEVVLCNMFRDSIINHKDLPIKLVSKTACFRKEKGNYGKCVKGMIRQYQFDKVELFQVVSEDTSYNCLENMVVHVEELIISLGLSYRVVSLCGGDTGFSSSKTYDIEIWCPWKKEYIEVSSCSNTESFQSFRLNIKYDNILHKNIHMLNGSGTALGRILISIIETYTDSNGTLFVPYILKKYLNGTSKIYNII